MIYGYSCTTGPDGKPRITEFGNVRQAGLPMVGREMISKLTAQREPLADIITSEKGVKDIMERPGISSKDHIKINAYDNSVEVFTSDKAESIGKRLNYQRN